MIQNTDQKINIAMVGYYNTLPFLYGLKPSDIFNLILDVPSKCMDYFDTGEADIALVPVATLLGRSDFQIITDYCIGCVGTVRTVSLFTNEKLENLTKIYLDRDSRTSQLLVKTLCEKFWQIHPVFEERNVSNMHAKDLKEDEAVLMIGDKVFEMEDSFQYNYDLGFEWQKYTGLSFAFAVWIARDNVDPETIKMLNNALGLGVNNINEVLNQNQSLATKIELSEYFNKYIDFHFNSEKAKALNLFFEYNKVLTV